MVIATACVPSFLAASQAIQEFSLILIRLSFLFIPSFDAVNEFSVA